MDVKEIFKALDNDIRAQIMRWLKDPDKNFNDGITELPEARDFEGGVSVGVISEKAGISQSTTSHYLDILLRAKLLESCRIGRWTFYRRNEETLREFANYMRNVF